MNKSKYSHLNVYRGVDGRNGDPAAFGLVCISIRSSDGSLHKYNERFDLSISKVQLIPRSGNGIIEPGCELDIIVTYYNLTTCPTPKFQVREFFNKCMY